MGRPAKPCGSGAQIGGTKYNKIVIEEMLFRCNYRSKQYMVAPISKRADNKQEAKMANIKISEFPELFDAFISYNQDDFGYWNILRLVSEQSEAKQAKWWAYHDSRKAQMGINPFTNERVINGEIYNPFTGEKVGA